MKEIKKIKENIESIRLRKHPKSYRRRSLKDHRKNPRAWRPAKVRSATLRTTVDWARFCSPWTVSRCRRRRPARVFRCSPPSCLASTSWPRPCLLSTPFCLPCLPFQRDRHLCPNTVAFRPDRPVTHVCSWSSSEYPVTISTVRGVQGGALAHPWLFLKNKE